MKPLVVKILVLAILWIPIALAILAWFREQRQPDPPIPTETPEDRFRRSAS